MNYIKDNNKDNKYQDLLNALDKYDNPNIGHIMTHIKYNNSDGKYDDLVAFIIGK